MPDYDKKGKPCILERQFCVEKHRKCAQIFCFLREPRSESQRKVNILKLWYVPHFKGIADKDTLQRRDRGHLHVLRFGVQEFTVVLQRSSCRGQSERYDYLLDCHITPVMFETGASRPGTWCDKISGLF